MAEDYFFANGSKAPRSFPLWGGGLGAPFLDPPCSRPRRLGHISAQSHTVGTAVSRQQAESDQTAGGNERRRGVLSIS